MRAEYRERWKQVMNDYAGALKKPKDLLSRPIGSEDFIDAAVIGGVSLSNILAGKIAEWQIPSNVLEAFHAQYPQYGASFVEAVNRFYGHPEQLMGLINGVKGKLFEIDYADWLNHGHLPSGFTAELAHGANNPGWDISIHDSHGHIAEFLQLKATESLSYVRTAIEAHPEIDVVVPHELYSKVVDADLLTHLSDGHESLHHLNGHVSDAIGHAESAGAAEHFPVIGPAIVISMVAAANWKQYRSGKLSREEAFRNIEERGLLAILATSASWALTALTHEPFVGLPVSVTVRLLGGQFLHNRRRRELLEERIAVVLESRQRLEIQVQRPLFISN
jgi:hypothetical protein